MPAGNKSSGGGGGGARGIRAGRAFVEFFGDDTKLARTLSGIKSKVMGLASSLTKIGAGSLGLGAGLLAPVTAFFASGVDRANDVKDLVDVFGLTAESASRLSFAFEVAGASTDDLMKSLLKLSKTNESGKPLDEYLIDVADSLGEIEDASERARVGQDLLSKQVMTFIDVGGDLNQLMSEANILTEQQLIDAEKLAFEWRKTGIELKSALIPALQYIVPLAQQVGAFVKQNSHLIPVVGAAGLGLTAFGVAALGAGAGLSALASIVTILGGGPVLALTLGLATLAHVFRDDLTTGVNDFAAGAVEAWGGIEAALKKGDLAGAAEIAFQGLKVSWAETVLWMQNKWNGLLNLQIPIKGHGDRSIEDILGGVRAGAALWWNDQKNSFIGRNIFGFDPKEIEADSKQVMLGHAADQAERDQARLVREAGLRAQAEELQQMKDRLAGLVAMGKDPGANPGDSFASNMALAGVLGAANRGRFGGGGDFNAAAAGFSQVKGSFNATAAGQMFNKADSIQKQQTDLLKEIRDNTAGLDALKDFGRAQ